MSRYQTEVDLVMELPHDGPGYEQIKVEFWAADRDTFLAKAGEAWDKLHGKQS